MVCLPTRSAILSVKHWLLEIDGYAVEYVRDGKVPGGPRSLHDMIAFPMGLSVRLVYWRCSSERLNALPERALLRMHIVSLPEKLRDR
jgi:hypothetical protein